MAFEKKAPQWHAAGTEPPESLKQSGFQAGYKPPAEFFNWQWHAVGEAIAELQGMKPGDIGALGRGDLEAHIKADNPHGITADKIGAAEARHTHAQGDVTGLSESLSDKADKVHGHEANEVSGLQDILAGKADRPVVAQAVLTADGWIGDKAPYEQIVNAAGVTADCVVIVGLGAGVNEQQVEVCRAARIEPAGQAEGAITVAAQGAKPDMDLPISVTIIK